MKKLALSLSLALALSSVSTVFAAIPQKNSYRYRSDLCSLRIEECAGGIGGF